MAKKVVLISTSLRGGSNSDILAAILSSITLPIHGHLQDLAR